VVAASAAPAPVDAPPGSATTFQINNLHDGASSDQLAAPLGKLWSHDFGEKATDPLMVNGRVFDVTIGDITTHLWSLDALTGDSEWSVDIGGDFEAVGIAADGTNVYAHGFSGELRAYAQATGALVWTTQLPGQYAFTSVPTVLSGTIYVDGAGGGGTLYAVNAATGKVRWTADVMNGDNSSPAVTPNGVYVSYACEVSYRFNPYTGANIWTHLTDCEGGGGETPVIHGANVYVRDIAGKPPVMLSVTTGAAVGAFTSSSATPPAFSSTDGFFPQDNGTLTAEDLATKTALWTKGDGTLVSAPLAIGNDVVTASSSGEVYMYDGATGAEVWSGNAGSPINASQYGALPVDMAESNSTLLVPATNTLVAFTPNGAAPPSTTTTTTAIGATTTTAPDALPLTVSVAPGAAAFGPQRVGTYGLGHEVTITNTGTDPVTIKGLGLAGANWHDFFGATDCFPGHVVRVLGADQACHAVIYFAPLKTGARRAELLIADDAEHSPQFATLYGSGTEGYFLAGSHGEIGNFGDAVWHGDATGIPLKAPMIAMTTTPNGAGYWLLARDGGIFNYGNAHFYGSTGNRKLNKPIVAMSATRDGRGYWLVGSDGGIFTFGDAAYHGSTGGLHLNKPVDGMASTIDGRGYWLVAADGGIFTFGNAHYYGSAGGMHLKTPVVQMNVTPSGRGYWLLTADGHLYPFGDAHNYGSAIGRAIVGFSPTPDGRGYWETGRDGNVYFYGNAPNFGSLVSLGIHADDVIAIAGTAPPLPPALLADALGRNTGMTPLDSLSPSLRPGIPRPLNARDSGEFASLRSAHRVVRPYSH
jgi:outer membrane protein assembly factor BamB